MVYNGAAYRTLDDAPPEGDAYGDPNRGCQSGSLPLPPGYALAPNDADSQAVTEVLGWSTHVVVMADGVGWKAGGYGVGEYPYDGSMLRTEAFSAAFSVVYCRVRVLARCP